MIMDKNRIFLINNSERGYTLVELLVAMAIFALVIASIYSSFASQNRIYHAQEKVVAIQQNVRAAMYVMERDLRMAGYDPERAGGTFGITACGPTTITFTQDDDANGTIETRFMRNGTTVTVERRVRQIAPNGTITVIADGILAENIQAFGLAYAYDSNGDGALDTSGGNIIWAIDTNNDNRLDLNLDTNTNGIINQADDTNADNVIEGVVLTSAIAAANIRAVRIWILGRSDPARPDMQYSDNNTYVVGRAIVNSPNDGLHRRMLASIVKCRNMGTR